MEGRLPADHPYRRVLAEVRRDHGPRAYPGSPLIAARLLRGSDRIELAERHPRERAALAVAMAGSAARIHDEDGPGLIRRLAPPDPRRGLLLVDPSYEVKAEYEAMAALLPAVARRWNVGVMILWYPILTDARHKAMAARLAEALPEALRHEVRFAPAREGHRMVGSGLFVVNPPWGFAEAAADLAAACFPDPPR
jgi:23S rRNA (adenine2030-N6)-methyltransferase